jgi:site-specific DNA-methyltransferase (adenine-specific)
MNKPISEVTNEDCMAMMARYPDKYFELAVVDPPYGIGQDGRNNHTRSKLAQARDYRTNSRYDNQAPEEDYWKELFRVSKNQIVWGANHFISRLPYDSPCWIVWDKDNGLSDFADCELAWTSFNTSVRRLKYRWAGMLQENMKNKEERIHPNHKPVALYKWTFTHYAKKGDKILDTHLGSQSSRIAAHDLGFDFYGTELDPEYFQQGCERFEKHISQLTLAL